MNRNKKTEYQIPGVVSVFCDEQVLFTVWHGYATSKQFRDTCEKVLTIIEAYGITRGLTDNRNMKMISSEDQNWLLTSFVPRLAALGYTTSAIVVPADYFARVSVDNIVGRIDENQILNRYFDDAAEAREWLKSLNVQPTPSIEESASPADPA